jgi:UPF0755 protein
MRTIAGFFAFLFLMVILAGGISFFVLMPKTDGPGPLADGKNVVITRGTGVAAIGHQLQKEGVIGSYMLFRLRHVLAGRPNLKAGEYAFGPHISIRDAIGMMEDGQVVVRQVTVPEGWTSAEVVDQLKRDLALSGEVAAIPPEGSISPDTYRYVYGDTREGLLQQMQKEMQAAVDTAWAQRDPDLPLQNQQQLVTLASIVEKETAVASERARVAGVYINRLRKNMLLQSDPTVIYGITNGTTPLGRAITVADLQKPTPYNTYTQVGLPPGPIANPGKASLLAAAKPEKNDYLYFVADGTGGHKFSATLDEHEKNVAEWRKLEREADKAAKANPAPTPTLATQPATPAAMPASPQNAAPPPAK